MKQHLLTKPKPVFNLWDNYCNYVETVMQPEINSQQAESDYLSNRLFTQAILYGLPAGIIALIPSVYLALHNGRVFLGVFNTCILFAVGAISLTRRLPIAFRKIAASGALIITAVVLTVFLGSFSIGYIYLLTCSVFYALHFSNKFARRAVWVNVAVCLAFTLAIFLKLIPTAAMASVSVGDFITYSINFLFLNIVIVVMIRYTMARLQRTMRSESRIHQKLKDEFQEKQLWYHSFRESDDKYQALFSLSPSANLIFDAETLCFLETNKAATEVYGYSEAEFLNMKLADIHPTETIPALMAYIAAENRTDGTLSPIRSQHVRKDGYHIHVEVLRSNIDVNGKPARMIVVTDITKQVIQFNAIQKQNAKLKEIVYIQSHLVRLPLTNIMALTGLIADEFKGGGDPKLLTALSQSSDELDELIKRVIHESGAILDDLAG